MFDKETWIQIAFTFIIELLTGLRDDPKLNSDQKKKFRKVFLKIFNMIKVIFANDPDFA
jgi:hypothetical protein